MGQESGEWDGTKYVAIINTRTPGTAIATGFTLVAIVLGLSFGLWPVNTYDIGFGDSEKVSCGNAWFKSDDLTPLGETDCENQGLGRNRIVSFVALGAAVAGIVTVIVLQNQSNDKQRTVAGLKKCPRCAEMIQPEAIGCRYCGAELAAMPPPAPPPAY